jgi:hypothetical protein
MRKSAHWTSLKRLGKQKYLILYRLSTLFHHSTQAGLKFVSVWEFAEDGLVEFEAA